MQNKYKKYIEKYKELSEQNLPTKEIVKVIGKMVAEDWFSNKMVNHTREYQKKYGFNAQKGDIKFSTHNNEADAFKHTFMQAWLTVNYGEEFAKELGDMHENDGKDRAQPSGEENMDLWNNNQGREIGKDLWRNFSYKNGYSFGTIPYFKFNDIIAEKVIQRMNEGKLITHPDDPRRYVQKNKNETTTGQAAPISNSNVHSTSSLASAPVKSEPKKEQPQNFSDIIRQAYKEKRNKNNHILNRIFRTHASSTDSGQGHWVTMNGTHVFIED